jgi:hypothetical protein
MKDDSRKRISDFSDEKYILATEYAKGRLPSLNFHLGAPGVLTHKQSLVLSVFIGSQTNLLYGK